MLYTSLEGGRTREDKGGRDAKGGKSTDVKEYKFKIQISSTASTNHSRWRIRCVRWHRPLRKVSEVHETLYASEVVNDRSALGDGEQKPIARALSQNPLANPLKRIRTAFVRKAWPPQGVRSDCCCSFVLNGYTPAWVFCSSAQKMHDISRATTGLRLHFPLTFHLHS